MNLIHLNVLVLGAPVWLSRLGIQNKILNVLIFNELWIYIIYFYDTNYLIF